MPVYIVYRGGKVATLAGGTKISMATNPGGPAVFRINGKGGALIALVPADTVTSVQTEPVEPEDHGGTRGTTSNR